MKRDLHTIDTSSLIKLKMGYSLHPPEPPVEGDK